MHVSVDPTGPSPTIGAVRGLFRLPFLGYDMRYHFGAMRDQRRFIVNAPLESMRPTPATVILNAPLP